MPQHRDRPFLQTYGDSIWHADAARHAPSSSVAAEKHTRASIIASAISLESAANCALAEANLRKEFLDDVDKLSSLAKFELAAQLRDKSFSAGDKRVADMRDLVKLRNDYVHPKERPIPIEITGVTEDESVAKVEFALMGDRFTNLAIEKRSKLWFPNDALIVLQKCTAFYNWYFLECLQMTHTDILLALGSLLSLDDQKPAWMLFTQSCIEDEVVLLKSMGVKMRFLDFSAIKSITIPG